MRRLGPEAVTAVDPSEPILDAVRERYPGVEVHRAGAEELPLPDHVFDVALAQLAVHFMSDPVAELGEMRRVTRPGAVVAACVWDYAGDQGPLGPFWRVARKLDADVADESDLPGVREGHLGELFRQAGLDQVEETSLTVSVEHLSFEDWWEPFTLGVGPAGSYVASLDPAARARLEGAIRASVPGSSFVVTALAWAARGIV